MLAIEGSTASGEPFKVADQCEFACQTKAPSNQEHEHCVAWIFNRVDSRFGGVGSCTLLSKFVRAGIVAPKQMATVTSGVNCPDLTPQVGEEKEAGILVTSIVELAGGEDKEDETRLATKEKQKQELQQQQRQEQKQQQQQHQQEEQEEQEQEQAQAHQQEHQQERTQREKQRQKQEQKRAQEKQEKQHQKQEKQHEKQEQQQKQHQRAQEQQKQQQEQKQKQKATSKEDDDW